MAAAHKYQLIKKHEAEASDPGMDVLAMPREDVPAELHPYLDQARRYYDSSKAASTRKAYASDWAIFEAWCNKVGLTALPAIPETVAAFLGHEAGPLDKDDIPLKKDAPKASTLTRRLAAIAHMHHEHRFKSPTEDRIVTATMKGIRRTHGTRKAQKAPATNDIVMQMADACDDSLAGKRDRALILVGFSAAFRRSDIRLIRNENIERFPEGVNITIYHSKGDQEGAGQSASIPYGGRYCPIRALEDYLLDAEIEKGPVFVGIRRGGHPAYGKPLSGQAIADIIKKYCKACGQDPKMFSGHSLRRGFATSAARAKKDPFSIRDQMRQKDINTTMQYVESAAMFDDHVGKGLL